MTIQQIITKALKEKEEKTTKENWWITDLSRCLSGVYYQRQGLEPDKPLEERVKRVLSVGNIFEDWITDLVIKYKDKQVKVIPQLRLELKDKSLSGRSDIILKSKDMVEIIELKTMHSNGFWYREKAGNLAMPQHIEQLMMYCYIYSLQEKQEIDKITGRVVYISKDDLTIAEYPVKYNENIVRQALLKLDILNKAWDDKKPPKPVENIVYDEVKKRWTVNWIAKYCPYHERCTGDKDWLKKAEAEVLKLNSKNLTD